MKSYILIFIPIIFIFTSCFFYSGIYGSGSLISSNVSVYGFYAVQAANTSDVTITRADYYSVTLICDDNLLPYINIYNDGYYLNIEMLPGYICYDYTFTVNITMPDINALRVNDSSSVQVSGFNLNDNLNLNVTESSNVKLFLTDAADITANVSGYSYLEIHSVYPVDSLDINCSEASTADLKEMLCSYGEITVNDASSLRVNMNGPIIGQVTGASTLFFRGSVSPGPILFSGASGIVYY